MFKNITRDNIKADFNKYALYADILCKEIRNYARADTLPS